MDSGPEAARVKEKHGQLDASFKQGLQIWYNKDKGVNIQENVLDIL